MDKMTCTYHDKAGDPVLVERYLNRIPGYQLKIMQVKVP
jgi:hypothetical protein